jgi:hypothetical protein
VGLWSSDGNSLRCHGEVASSYRLVFVISYAWRAEMAGGPEQERRVIVPGQLLPIDRCPEYDLCRVPLRYIADLSDGGRATASVNGRRRPRDFHNGDQR